MIRTLDMEVNWPSFANFFMPKPQNLPVTHNLQEFISSYRFFLLTPVVVDHSWSNHSSIDSNKNKNFSLEFFNFKNLYDFNHVVVSTILEPRPRWLSSAR